MRPSGRRRGLAGHETARRRFLQPALLIGFGSTGGAGGRQPRRAILVTAAVSGVFRPFGPRGLSRPGFLGGARALSAAGGCRGRAGLPCPAAG